MEGRQPIGTIGSFALVAVLLAALLPWGCTRRGLSGEYADEMGVSSYTFKPNGKVVMSTLGARMELDYELDGNDVKIKMPGATMLLGIEKDGALAGPMGVRYRKREGATEVREPGLASPSKESDLASLQGSWRVVTSTFYRSDGTTGDNTQGRKCRLEFSGERELVECPDSRGNLYRLTNTVRVLRPGRLRAEVVESAIPANIGKAVELDFRIQQDRLSITAYPSAFPGAPATAPVKVDTVYEREGRR
jgi:hypothetical protein